MASHAKDSIGKRKGHSIFLSAFGSSDKTDKAEKKEAERAEKAERQTEKQADKKSSLRKLGKKSSILNLRTTRIGASTDREEDHSTSSLSPTDQHERSNSTRSNMSVRPRTLTKGRPASVFGSMTNKYAGGTLEEGDEDDFDGAHSYPQSPQEEDIEKFRSASYGSANRGKTALLHGEVQTTSGLFRKKKEYLVLTETHFMRFKSMAKAVESFPSLVVHSASRGGTARHSSSASIGSVQDLQSLNSHASTESNDHAIPLKQIVATYKAEDKGLLHTTDVVFLDEEHGSLGSVQVMLNSSMETDLWHSSIRAASQKARLISSQPYPDRVLRYLIRIVENALDYAADSFHVFRVVRRATGKGTKMSNDDLKALSSNMNYMVIGINKLHLISLPDFSDPSEKSMDAKASKQSFGLVTLVSMDVRYSDDTFELGFRLPLQQPITLDLAAASAPEIATLIHKSILYLKPQWLDYTFLYGGPPELLDDSGCPQHMDEDNGWFDKTLVAYCMAYNCNPGRIRYAIDLEKEDAPEFMLMQPDGPNEYSVMELLSIFRSLRFNETFRSISFAGVSLQALYGLVDVHGRDHVAVSSRSGLTLRKVSRVIIEPVGKSLLYQEIQALALKAKRLKRLDLTDTLPRRRVRDTFDEEGAIDKDPGCEYAAALLPLCRIYATNIDYLVFNGIELSETDIEEISLALHDIHHVRFRSVEVSRCGLADRGMQLLLNAFEHQVDLECINVSDNPGRLQMEKFAVSMSRFNNLRRLDLSRAIFSKGSEALIAPKVMLSWRLEELVLTGIPINDKTLDTISTYLASDMSSNLYRLQMDQCNLTGQQVSVMMRSMCNNLPTGTARPLRFNISANRLEKGNSDIVKAIEEDCAPTHLTMRMVEYGTESRFRQLLQAVTINTTILSLDISKASLPTDASDETCAALRSLFEDNHTLTELDISGEHAHLEIARFGIGLSNALTGLRKNTALRVLKIEYQGLGMEGANTLATVLQDNRTLEMIHCEHNGINQQGFRILVNALAENFTVLFLPDMKDDQSQNIKDIISRLSAAPTSSYSNHRVDHNTGTAMKGVRGALKMVGVSKASKEDRLDTPQNRGEMARALGDAWRGELDRMQDLLARNYRIAQGLETIDGWLADNEGQMRPTTAISDTEFIHQVLSNSTPKVELGNPIDASVDDENARSLANLDLNGNGHRDENGEHSGLIGEGGKWDESETPPPEIIVGSYDSTFDMANMAAAGRAFELGLDSSSTSDTEASSLKSHGT